MSNSCVFCKHKTTVSHCVFPLVYPLDHNSPDFIHKGETFDRLPRARLNAGVIIIYIVHIFRKG